MIGWPARGRHCLSVPGSSRKMIDKARTLPADEIFPGSGGRGGRRREGGRARWPPRWPTGLELPAAGFPLQRLDHPWTCADVVEVVGGAATAGGRIDVIVLPKVSTSATCTPWTCCWAGWSASTACRWADRHRRQIADAAGRQLDAIAARPRVGALVPRAR